MKVTDHHRKMKLRAIDYKGGKCLRCGYSKSPASLSFHHTDPTQKDFPISSRTCKWETLQPELDKCLLLCLNCHGEEHAQIDEATQEFRRVEIRKYVRERVSIVASVTLVTCHTCKKPVRRRVSQIRCDKVFCSIQCSSGSQVRVDWPESAKLQKMVLDNPITTVAKQLGVSGTAVKKRCKKLGLETRERGFWAKQYSSNPRREMSL